MSQVYRALAFYRRRLFAEAAAKGHPVVRHLLLHYPDDPEALGVDNEFLLGSEILVAPILDKCWTWPICRHDKRVYLPRGEWVHLWTGATYGSPTEGTWVNVNAPIGRPAVFYKAGSEVGATFVQNLRAAGIEIDVARPTHRAARAGGGGDLGNPLILQPFSAGN